MRDIVKIGCILMIYTLVVGVALAFVNIRTEPVIEANKVAAENAARAEVLPYMDGNFELQGGDTDFSYWIGYKDMEKSEIGGYIIIARESGYSSIIETMIGTDVDGIITGVKILFQQETPGLGARSVEILSGESEPWFTCQFKGKSITDGIKITEDGGSIDAITGATITSRAITDSIHREIMKLKEIMGIQS